MNEGLSNLESMVSAALANQQGPTAENIRELIENLRLLPMFARCHRRRSGEACKASRRACQHHHNRLGSILIERDHTPWLDAARARIDPYYWNRYQAAPDSGGLPHRLDHHIG